MDRTVDRWSKFSALSFGDQRFLIAAFLLMPVCALGPGLFGFARFTKWIEAARVSTSRQPSPEAVRALGTLVNIAAGHSLVRVRCLTRSLTLHWLLRRRHIASDLRIGVELDGGAFNAHAWVEYVGVPINDTPDVVRRYAAFDRLETSHPHKTRDLGANLTFD